jgi:hypothetical protein
LTRKSLLLLSLCAAEIAGAIDEEVERLRAAGSTGAQRTRVKGKDYDTDLGTQKTSRGGGECLKHHKYRHHQYRPFWFALPALSSPRPVCFGFCGVQTSWREWHVEGLLVPGIGKSERGVARVLAPQDSQTEEAPHSRPPQTLGSG